MDLYYVYSQDFEIEWTRCARKNLTRTQHQTEWNRLTVCTWRFSLEQKIEFIISIKRGKNGGNLNPDKNSEYAIG